MKTLFTDITRTVVIGAVVGMSSVAGWSGSAGAQEVSQQVDVERFRMTADHSGILNTEWGQVPAHLDWNLGVWFGAADDPLTVYRVDSDSRERLGSLVNHRVAGTLMGSIGLWNRLELGLEVPLVLSQGQDSITELMTSELRPTGFGDIRVSPKVQVLAKSGWYLAFTPGFTLPTGRSDDYRGTGGISLLPEFIVSKAAGDWRGSVNLGYRTRERIDLPQLVVDDEWVAHAGIGYSLARRGLPAELDVTISAATSAAAPMKSFNTDHLEVATGVTYHLPGSLVATAGAGIGLQEGYGTPDWRIVGAIRWSHRQNDPDHDGLTGDADLCPRQAETVNSFEDMDGCPDALPDRDGDGILDPMDECPAEAEDMDHVADEDGCPDPDNDSDGVLDVEDNCPDEPGTEDYFGCAEPQSAKITGGKIELLDSVYFDTNRDVIQERSHDMLRNVAAVIAAHQEIGMVYIEGHTDSDGGDAFNMDLSQRRADAVRAFLVAQGVNPDILAGEGFGETQPIADNGTAEGRAKNRRVEFRLETTTMQ